MAEGAFPHMDLSFGMFDLPGLCEFEDIFGGGLLHSAGTGVATGATAGALPEAGRYGADGLVPGTVATGLGEGVQTAAGSGGHGHHGQTDLDVHWSTSLAPTTGPQHTAPPRVVTDAAFAFDFGMPMDGDLLTGESPQHAVGQRRADDPSSDDGDSDEHDAADSDARGGEWPKAGGNASRSQRNGSGQRAVTAEEKRARRLERNRESARQSRRRKKQYLDELQKRVQELHAQTAILRSQHCGAADATLDEQRGRLLREMAALADKDTRTPEEDAILADVAQQMLDRFGPNCAERRAVREFHFDQLQRLLLPPHTKFLLWLVHQPQEFFAPSKPFSSDMTTADATAARLSLWTLLCSEVGLSHDQSEKLRTSLRRIIGTSETPRETWRLGVASAYLARLRSALSARAAAAQAQLEALAVILTPPQFVRYLAWIDANRDHVLGQIDVTLTKASIVP